MQDKEKKKLPDDVCWCGHKKSEHNGDDGMCDKNTEREGSCECGGYEKP